MHIHRIIHPVGQGAFYSEHFILKDGEEVNVVYDCGAEQPWKYALDREISNFDECKNGVIDALFISHFDEDHVNGIYDMVTKQSIKINKVILPVLEKEKWLRITDYGIEYHHNYLLILEALRQSQSQLIFVDPVVEGQDRISKRYALESLEGRSLRRNADNIDTDLNDIIVNSQHINSGDYIAIGEDSVEWIYVPIYFKSLLDKRDEVKDAIEKIPYKGRAMTVKDLENNIGNLPADDLKKVNDAYKSVFNQNNNKPSMLCYSGPLKLNTAVIDDYMFDSYYPLRYYCFCNWYHEYCRRIIHYHLREKKIATLYTGDSTLKKWNCIEVASILNMKGKNLKHACDLVSYIEAMQLPHHGSKYNITLKSVEQYLGLDLRLLITFASFGLGNSYNHPNTGLIKALHNKHSLFFGVYELPYTRLEDSLYIE